MVEYKGTIYTLKCWHSTSSLDSFTLSRFRRSAFNVPEFPVNGRTAECAWVLCFRWNISHPILWDLGLGAGIYILIINFKKGICIKQEQFNHIDLDRSLWTAMKACIYEFRLFIHCEHFWYVNLVGNLNLVGNVHLVKWKREQAYMKLRQ